MKVENNWRTKTLELLENHVWPSAEYDSFLIRRCHELRKKVLNEFTVEDLRIMIGQQIGIFYLIPLAVEILTKNLIAEGDFYEGDLLQNVLKVDSAFWDNNQKYRKAIYMLIKNREVELAERKIDMGSFY